MPSTDAEISKQEDYVNVLRYELEKVADEFSELENKYLDLKYKCQMERQLLELMLRTSS